MRAMQVVWPVTPARGVFYVFLDGICKLNLRKAWDSGVTGRHVSSTKKSITRRSIIHGQTLITKMRFVDLAVFSH